MFAFLTSLVLTSMRPPGHEATNNTNPPQTKTSSVCNNGIHTCFETTRKFCKSHTSESANKQHFLGSVKCIIHTSYACFAVVALAVSRETGCFHEIDLL